MHIMLFMLVAPTPYGTEARAPTFTNGWAWGTIGRRMANKKLTEITGIDHHDKLYL